MYLWLTAGALTNMNAFERRRTTDPDISDAITLGWRIATLYSLRADELPTSPPDNLLPMRRSLPASERLVLELRAAAGDAGRLGLGLEPAALDELVRLAEQAPDSSAIESEFRARIRAWHIDLQTMLWAEHEATGKAYELGSFLSDTSNRVVLELRRSGDACEHVTGELREVFSARRVERVKRLLDDLQTRIDPAAVRIVKQHLERWRSAVCDRTADCATRADLDPLDSQAVVWFQLVSGAKEPEAFIDHDDRERVRGTMFSRTIGTYLHNWRLVVAAACGLGALVALSVLLVTQTTREHVGTILAIITPIAGALGISLASVGRTVRKSLDVRAELLWNTALVDVISAKTLCVDELLPETAARTWRAAAPVRSAAGLRATRAS